MKQKLTQLRFQNKHPITSGIGLVVTKLFPNPEVAAQYSSKAVSPGKTVDPEGKNRT